jgi:hypothetical protein
MAFERPTIPSALSDEVRLPCMEPSLSGPGRVGESRPPTSDLLPGDSWENHPVPCLNSRHFSRRALDKSGADLRLPANTAPRALGADYRAFL